MNRWKLLASCVFIVIIAANDLAAQPSQPASGRTNVLLICVDDLKPALGCYGDSHAVTPNIDRLAASGIRFEMAFCNQAVCSPSRNALLTGLRPQTLGIYDLGTNFRKSRPDAVTVGQHFKRHGYQTHSLGKIFHAGHGNQEDEASWDFPPFKPKAPAYAIAGNGPVPDPNKTGGKSPRRQRNSAPRGTATESADVADEFYADGLIAVEAIQRLEKAAKSSQPFFMAVGFLKPHLPFVAPKRYWDMHHPDQLPQPILTNPPEGAPDFAPTTSGELRNYRGMPASPTALDAATTRHLIHGYYAATSYMDAQVGKLLVALEQTGLRQSTLVVLWGDHGWHLGDHGMWCKHTNYEQATRIPLIISMPGKSPGVSKAIVETVDIYPTLAELAGLPPPAGLDGLSFAKLISEPYRDHRDHAIHVYPRGGRLGRAIRTARYRLVEWNDPGSSDQSSGILELYDYQTDPNESKNWVSSRPEVVEQLRHLLARHPIPRPQIQASNVEAGE